MSFEQLGLAPQLLQAVAEAGYTQPTPVQSQAIPPALAGYDLLVSSQTGSGKTAAFLLPCLQRLMSSPAAPIPRVLVLTPTRELAQQVARAAADLTGRRGVRIGLLVGGAPYTLQLRQLKGPLDLVVATPGRLMDHLERGRLDLSNLQTLVLDEADRMLDMGFIEDIEAIVARLPAGRQTLLFSATLDGVVGRLAARVTRAAQRIETGRMPEQAPRIEQKVLYADGHDHKLRLLEGLLCDRALRQAVVFTATKAGAEDLASRLKEQGHAVHALHGDMHQGARNRALRSLREGRTRILVATDVAARGLDVPGISHVVNFDLPMAAEDYIHRIGRTGRAGREGWAYTLVHHREHGRLKGIERALGGPIPVTTLPGLEPRPLPGCGRGIEVRNRAGRGLKPAGGKGRRPTGPRPMAGQVAGSGRRSPSGW